MSKCERWLAVGWVLIQGAAGIALVLDPANAPLAVFMGLATTLWPLARTWRSARGTALRATVVWGLVAVILGLSSQALAFSEPLGTGRPLAGHATYLSGLATLAALISVLNARSPGGAAWAILMGLLVLVFLIPWLEGPGLARNAGGLARLRLETPWTLFYLLLVLAGVANFLPTRYGPASGCLAVGFAVEYLALTRSGIASRPLGMLWSVFPWALSGAVWTAFLRSLDPGRATSRLEATWCWFRDHWGVVWGMRILERFNRAAAVSGWPFRLGWFGLADLPGEVGRCSSADLEPARQTLLGLLVRFADASRIDEAAGPASTTPCQPPVVQG